MGIGFEFGFKRLKVSCGTSGEAKVSKIICYGPTLKARKREEKSWVKLESIKARKWGKTRVSDAEPS